MISNNMQVSQYIKDVCIENIPDQVIEKAKICLLDLLGAILGGSKTQVASLARDFAETIWPGNASTIITSGKKTNCAGAAFANSFQANAIDIDDGFRPVKGHPGALIIPAALAVSEGRNITGLDLIEALVVGYEIGTRAGIIWHKHYPIYHASGAWGSIAAASTSAKILDLDVTQISHALGIAEYQAPINPMMRCIDYPSMLKDGIGWGCPVGVISALMAEKGFTGIPSLFEIKEYEIYLQSLGKEYNLLKIYFKPYACCRWAQPAVEGVIKLTREYNLKPWDIQTIKVFTFHEGTCLQKTMPKNTEEALYNICYPIASAIIDGEVGPKQVSSDYLNNPAIIDIVELIEVIHDSSFDNNFPEVAESKVEITTHRNKKYSGIFRARGDWDLPLDKDEIIEKFFWLASHSVSREKAQGIADIVSNLEEIKNIDQLLKALW